VMSLKAGTLAGPSPKTFDTRCSRIMGCSHCI